MKSQILDTTSFNYMSATIFPKCNLLDKSENNTRISEMCYYNKGYYIQ